jgi:hypothetical protein
MTTTAFAYNPGRVPKTKVSKIPPVSIPVGAFVTAGTRSSIMIRSREGGYTDERFYADLKKASKWIDAMGDAAVKEHAEGKTRKLP